ncbi:MAG: 4-(cytidine 5'-diphospho)-2-C-methyl-D-erythritol kinase [Parvularculaceae bacterium]
MIEVVAPAKINLFLHVGPLRPDGLHALASLFVFADAGDLLSAAPAKKLSLSVKGPFADALADVPPEKNLILRAAELLRNRAGASEGAALRLDKRLPVAAGVGGGSADAAAALSALVRLWELDIAEKPLADIAFRLGADVPACLHRRPIYVSGAGEVIEPGPELPPLWAALVNPGVALSTGFVFKAFDAANPSPPPPAPPRFGCSGDYAALKDYLSRTRNDLEPFAIEKAPAIGAALKMLQECPDALITRMSGSGATCFALFGSEKAAEGAVQEARKRGWWGLATPLAGHTGAE